MAEKPVTNLYPYSIDSPTINREYPEKIRRDLDDEDEEDGDDEFDIIPSHHPSSMRYDFNSGHRSLSPSVPSSAVPCHATDFHILLDAPEEEDEDEDPSEIWLGLQPPTPVPIQRVSSEDEFNFCSKRKRAKFIGPYLFGDVIGQGSYAKVKECLDRRNLCRRAVKIMQRRRLRRTPYGEKMAATEIRILKKLNHSNIIKLYDIIRNDEKQKLYLFIDLCVVSLQEMLDATQSKSQIKVFPIWQAHGYFVQLIQGLEYLHSKFIIHNDIKPGNLLITVDHQLKITDFGTAEQLDMFSPDDTIRRSQGTPAFQCPEIANGDDTYRGFSVDIWSCGVTLYNLVTGKLPFDAENIYLLFQTIAKGIYIIPDDIEPHLRSLIDGLLHIDNNSRFSIEQIKQHDWFRRRPPRTFDYLPFPPLALNRFQTFTMHDYLAELHQPSTDIEDDQSHVINVRDTNESIAVDDPPVVSTQPLPSSNHQVEPKKTRRRRTNFNCGCSRTTSSEHLQRTSGDHRICSLS